MSCITTHLESGNITLCYGMMTFAETEQVRELKRKVYEHNLKKKIKELKRLPKRNAGELVLACQALVQLTHQPKETKQ